MSTAFLIREDRGHWVGEVASAVHAAGLRAVLVAPPLSPDERAELASVVDDVVAVDNVYEPDAVAATMMEYSSAPFSSRTFTNWATVERFWPIAT